MAIGKLHNYLQFHRMMVYSW